jgi:non-heme chloroperoxidase
MTAQTVQTDISDRESQLSHLRAAAAVAGMELSEVLLPTEYDVLAGRIRLHYLDWSGPEGARDILFLHGGGLTSHTWDLTCLALRDTYRCLALDQRGHGESEAAESFAVADLVADAIAFVDHLGGAPVHLVGHSLGTIVAQRVAERRPDLLASLTLISAAPSTSGHAGLQEMRGDLAAFADHVPRDYATGFQASTVHRPLAPAQLAVFVDESMKLPLAAWRGTVDGLLADSASPAPIEIPTLSIWGVRDGVFDALAQQALAHKIPGAVALVYQDIGHAPHWEAPGRVAKDIENFILSLPEKP